MATSSGQKHCTRYKLKNSIRERGLSPTSKAIQKFCLGQMVHVDIDASLQRGYPNPKFQGITGKVIGQRGRAYLLSVKDGKSTKEIIVLPQHLKPQKYN